MEDIKTLLGRRIRHLRNRRGITQEELGDKADVNYKYLGAIERGERNPSIDNLAKIAKALGIQLHELFVFEHEIEDTQVLKKRIDDLLKNASKKEFKTIYGMVEAILK
jgi:transcriptional regulator with XRE-family HTH domain